MADTSIKDLADKLGVTFETLSRQFKDAGINKSSPHDLVSDAEKEQLLVFLKGLHLPPRSDLFTQTNRIAQKVVVRAPPKKPLESADANNLEASAPSVFLSYSWDSKEYKFRVRQLCKSLRFDGVDAILDQWEVHPGDQLTHFMENAIKNSEYILILCSERYCERANSRRGGVGYEGSIITSEIFSSQNRRKFIPVLMSGSPEISIPTFLSACHFIDLSNEQNYEDGYLELLITLYKKRERPPKLGSIPDHIRGLS